jgi:ABC-type nitrate/sulfonate/bicarbonate transport system permease component
MRRLRLQPILWTLATLAVWEAVGRAHLLLHGAIPAPSAIIGDWWAQREVYALHAWATIEAAFLGFVAGDVIAIVAAICFVLWPVTERLTRGISITVFAIPAITLGPILVLAFRGIVPQVILSAVCVYFPTMVATLIGLREIDPRPVDVIRAYGGNKYSVLRLVRLRAALPSVLAGLRVAAPAAVLGAILAEFGSGARWGLGTFLLGSLGQAKPERLWGIGLCATAVAALGYIAFALIARTLTHATAAVTIAANSAPDRLGVGEPRSRWQEALLPVAAVAVPLIAWWAILKAINLSPVIARDPIATFNYLFLAENAASARERLIAAFAETLPVAAVGMLLGLGAAFILASLSVLKPVIVKALLPPSLLLQTMPLVALTPIIVLIFGRGWAAMLAVTVAVVFFPAFVTLSQGLALVPRAALDVVRAYGTRPRKELMLVSVPFALPYLFAAARLVAPRALLGAMIAEWLATGTGVGQLLNASRGMLDYGMIWATALVSVTVAVLAYQLVTLVERAFIRA